MGANGRQLVFPPINPELTNVTTATPVETLIASELLARLEEKKPWCAVCVRPRWEKLVAEALAAKEYEQLLPLYRKRSQWADRVKEIELPLFPGYVFCRADFSSGPPLVTTPGVLGLLRFGDTLARISESEIAGMRAIMASGLPAGPWPYLSGGQRVRIDSGSLRGFEGILLQIKNEFRIVLTVEALGRSVSVEIDRASITPLSTMPV